ncbi:efflux transporter outer membrane subunit [Bartonella sp. DGB2]|uniref:efflux transporter outer membrane subunit n=1 Tax=Bartonella sp. DGB2 TaxID=3388426 RepID=UPI00398FF8A1
MRNTGLNVQERLFLLLGLLTLSGCVVGPDYQKPVLNVPSDWSSANQSATKNNYEKNLQLAGWWRRLNDPILNQLVDEVIKNNTSVATAQANLRAARATYIQTGGAFLPSLDGSLSYTKASSDAAKGLPYSGGIKAGWDLDLFGANKRAREGAFYGLQGAENDLRFAMLTVIGDVATSYVQLRSTQQKLALMRDSLISQKQTLQLTRDKLRAGAATQLDVGNAEGQVADTEASIPQVETQLMATVHRIAVLTGRPPAALNAYLQKPSSVPQVKWPIPMTVPAALLNGRPDVLKAERQFAQATVAIGQKEASFYPSLSLGGAINTSAMQLGDLASASNIVWSLAPGLSIPIFHGGQRIAALMGARAQRDQAFIAYQNAVLKALEDVENALVALNNERRRYTHTLRAAALHKKSMRLAYALYKEGNNSFLDLLNAQRGYYAGQQSLIDSQLNLVVDYINLMKAFGGGWDGAVDAGQPLIIDHSTGPHFIKRQK